jgi:prepilin-type processing-associated H-X9-DG protein
MHSRIGTFAYVAVLLAAAVMALGPLLGVAAALVVGLFWRLSLANQPRIHSFEVVLSLLILGGAMVADVLKSVHKDGRMNSRITTCAQNLRQFAFCLLDYAPRKGELPQAVSNGPNGRPFHSWRTSILPTLDYAQIVEGYNWEEPWNSPHNSQVLSAQVDVFQCSSDHPQFGERRPATTSYFAVVGPQTAWPPDRGLPLSEITDGRDQTIMLLEAAGLNVPWGEPRDLTYDEAVEMLTAPSDDRVVHTGGVNAAFADGAVRFLPVPMNRKMAEALLTVRGGDSIDWDTFERDARPEPRPVNYYPLIAFAIVALWPARRAFRKRSVLAPGSSNRG